LDDRQDARAPPSKFHFRHSRRPLKPRAHFYGDSFVAGYLDPAGLGWVGRIAERCAGIDFANHGVPGATSEAGVRQWFNTQLEPQRKETVVFSFGTNDVIYGVPSENSLAALTRALDRADEFEVPAYVVGPPDAPGIADAYAGIAAARDVPFFDTVIPLGPGSAWRAEANAGDGSHPGAGGYAELADLLDEAGLVEWLTKMSSR
jgi:lysophospholipase L1-like esterase